MRLTRLIVKLVLLTAVILFWTWLLGRWVDILHDWWPTDREADFAVGWACLMVMLYIFLIISTAKEALRAIDEFRRTRGRDMSDWETWAKSYRDAD